jgi:hypothetical protein
VCAALSSDAFPKLKKKWFQGDDDSLDIDAFTEVIFCQLYETHPKILDELEAPYAGTVRTACLVWGKAVLSRRAAAAAALPIGGARRRLGSPLCVVCLHALPSPSPPSSPPPPPPTQWR